MAQALFWIQFQPEVRQEGEDWIYQYGDLIEKHKDVFSARQALVRAVHNDPWGIINSAGRAVGKTPEGTFRNLWLDFDSLPIDTGDGKSAFIRIDYAVVRTGGTWTYVGAGNRRTTSRNPLEAKQALVGQVYQEAQQLISGEGIGALVADPIRAGVTGVRMVDLNTETEIEGHSDGIIVEYKDRPVPRRIWNRLTTILLKLFHRRESGEGK